jgi:hypothetical protein
MNALLLPPKQPTTTNAAAPPQLRAASGGGGPVLPDVAMARLACRVQELEAAAAKRDRHEQELRSAARASAAAAARSAAELAAARHAWQRDEAAMAAQRKELQVQVSCHPCLSVGCCSRPLLARSYFIFFLP